MDDRRNKCAAIGVQVTLAYKHEQNAAIDDTQAGEGPGGIIERALKELGSVHIPGRLSADLISRRRTDPALRVIEVKARSTLGPVSIQERQLNTLLAAGRNGWLYVVWNALQTPDLFELRTISDPGRTLTWTLRRPGPRWRPAGCRHEPVFRGGQHELEYTTTAEEINRYEPIDLSSLRTASGE